MSTVTFEDLTTGSDGTAPVPNAYQGLYWTGFTAYDDATYHPGRKEAPSFRHGTTSGDQAVVLDQAASGRSTSQIAAQHGTFTLKGAEVTPGSARTLEFDVYGYDGKQLIYQEHFQLNSTSPFHLTFDMAGITRVLFSEAAGGPRIVMDDLQFGHVRADSFHAPDEAHGAGTHADAHPAFADPLHGAEHLAIV